MSARTYVVDEDNSYRKIRRVLLRLWIERFQTKARSYCYKTDFITHLYIIQQTFHFFIMLFTNLRIRIAVHAYTNTFF